MSSLRVACSARRSGVLSSGRCRRPGTPAGPCAAVAPLASAGTCPLTPPLPAGFEELGALSKPDGAEYADDACSLAPSRDEGASGRVGDLRGGEGGAGASPGEDRTLGEERLWAGLRRAPSRPPAWALASAPASGPRLAGRSPTGALSPRGGSAVGEWGSVSSVIGRLSALARSLLS